MDNNLVSLACSITALVIAVFAWIKARRAIKDNEGTRVVVLEVRAGLVTVANAGQALTEVLADHEALLECVKAMVNGKVKPKPPPDQDCL